MKKLLFSLMLLCIAVLTLSAQPTTLINRNFSLHEKFETPDKSTMTDVKIDVVNFGAKGNTILIDYKVRVKDEQNSIWVCYSGKDIQLAQVKKNNTNIFYPVMRNAYGDDYDDGWLIAINDKNTDLPGACIVKGQPADRIPSMKDEWLRPGTSFDEVNTAVSTEGSGMVGAKLQFLRNSGDMKIYEIRITDWNNQFVEQIDGTVRGNAGATKPVVQMYFKNNKLVKWIKIADF